MKVLTGELSGEMLAPLLKLLKRAEEDGCGHRSQANTMENWLKTFLLKYHPDQTLEWSLQEGRVAHDYDLFQEFNSDGDVKVSLRPKLPEEKRRGGLESDEGEV